MQDRITDATAAGAITSPIWLQWLYDATTDFSEWAALWLPILGVIWLAVQIWSKIVTTEKIIHKDDHKSED